MYRSKGELMSAYNPDLQTKYCIPQHRTRCIVGNAPRLKEVIEAYGIDCAESWISIQLFNLSEYMGVKEKINTEQIRFMASSIANEYPALKLTEIMCLCYDLKRGKYGKMYGSIDPVVIMQAVEKYWKERTAKIADYEKEIERKQREQTLNNRKCISYAEYMAQISNKTTK